MFRSNVLVCGGTGCTSSNSEQIIEKRVGRRKASRLSKSEQAAQKRVNRQKTSGRRMAAQTYLSTVK